MPVAPDGLLQILDTLDYHIAMYDRDWRYTYVNAEAARLLGRPADELLGRSIWDLYPEAVGNQYYRELHEVAATRRVIHSDHYYAPFRQWFENHIYPLPDGVMVLAREVTEERQAARAAELLRLAQRAGGVATFEWDFENLEARCSAEFFRIFGLPERDGTMTAGEWGRFVHPDDRERMAAHLERALRGEEAASADYRIVAADGTLRWLSYAGRIERLAPGVRLIGTVLDITERKRTEEALRVSEERLQLALESAQMVAWDWDLRTDRVTLSPSALAILGLTENVPMTHAAEGLARVAPADRAVLEALIEEAKAAGGSWTSEVRFLRPSDNRTIWLENRGRVRLNPEGRPTSASGVLIDVTKRVSAQRRAGQLAFMLEATPDFVGIATPDGRIQYINPAGRRMVGIPPDVDPSSLNQSDLMPEWVIERTAREWLPEATREGTAFGEGALLASDGREVPVSFVLLVHRGRVGEVEYLSTIARDVTERKRADAALEAARDAAEAANRLKDQFLATLSHELRTPLNAILGYARMLQSDAVPPDRRRHAIDVIERNAVTQHQLIEELLDMSRITAGKLRLEIRETPVASILLEAVEGVKPAADPKRIEIEVECDPDAGSVRADATRLQQVFWNLLSNAVKFTPAGGRVNARLRRDGDCIEVSVTDTGAGIAPEFVPFIFDPFRQADARVGRVHGGLGLGLAISRELVELHGGTIRAASRGPGHGATFTLRLPRASAAAAGAPVRRARSSSAPPAAVRPVGPCAVLDGLDVLLVDDQEDTLSLFREALEGAGARVRLATSAAEALREAANRRPDVLVSDLGLPGADGYELVRRLHALDGERSVPAVAVSAFVQAEDRARALDAGFLAHLAKPLDPDVLVRTLAGLVAAGEGR